MASFYDWMYNILGFFFGPVMSAIFSVVKNYGVAIILFTIFCRLLMLPSAITQQKSMAKNQRMQFKLRKITERYKDDKRRQQEETQEFYRREGYNPMSAGCSASMFIQFPIIFGLIAAIYRPLQYTVKIGAQALEVLSAIITTGGIADIKNASRLGSMWQLQVVSHFKDFAALMRDGALTLSAEAFEKLKPETVEWLVAAKQLTVAEGTPGASFAAADVMAKIEVFTHQFSLGPLDLGVVPQEAKGWYILIPILAGVASMASSVYTYFRSRKQNPEQAKNPMMGCMTFGMPLFSVFLAFGFPAGVAIYWIISSLIAFLQMLILNYTHKPAAMLAKVMVEETIQRRSRENSRRKIYETR